MKPEVTASIKRAASTMDDNKPDKQWLPFKQCLMLHETGVKKKWINEHNVTPRRILQAV